MPAIGSLWIYPVKSARGVQVDSLDLDDRGAVGDRRWMITDERYDFLSQRDIPKLSLIVPCLTPEGLSLQAPGMEPIDVQRPTEDDVTGTVWDGAAQVRLASNEASEWCSTYLGRTTYLVHQPDEAVLAMDRKYAGAITSDRRIPLSDGSPLLLICQASLDDLNRRLAEPIPMNRFRPNLVVSGTAPFAEDGWRQIEVNSVVIEISTACPRCSITTVDQASGVRGVEPLRTLATFRRAGSEVYFGRNAAHHGPGRIRVGDRVSVIS